ncbi:hypothetical protein [Natronomonas amylolytica]|uniref:hypothetical protein n=1 Tax=Natronomonas amylolytica TaxID=3108498 RepID=UPI0030081F54
MNRRSLIAGAGAALSAPLVGRLPVPAGATHDRTDDGADSPDLDSFDPTAVRTELAVGSREGVADPEANRPHGVSVWNAMPDVSTVEVRIVDVADDRVVLELTTKLAADAAVEFSLLEPSAYRLDVRVPAMDARETVEVSRSWFDCNGSSTQVGVFEDGRIDSRTVTTLLECADVTVSETPSE